MDIIFRHRSGGELWQGDTYDVRDLAKRYDNKIRTIGLFAIEFQPDIRSGHYEVLKHGFHDNPWMGEAEARKLFDLADSVTDKLAARIRSGDGVISTCAAGLNRSALISAFAVMKLTDLSSKSVIKMIRKARGPDALHNPSFVRVIHDAHPRISAMRAAWTSWS